MHGVTTGTCLKCVCVCVCVRAMTWMHRARRDTVPFFVFQNGALIGYHEHIWALTVLKGPPRVCAMGMCAQWHAAMQVCRMAFNRTEHTCIACEHSTVPFEDGGGALAPPCMPPVVAWAQSTCLCVTSSCRIAYRNCAHSMRHVDAPCRDPTVSHNRRAAGRMSDSL